MASPKKIKKYITFDIPPALVDSVEALKDECQQAGLSLTGRQVIGRDGVAIAALAYLMAMPKAKRVKAVQEGLDFATRKILKDAQAAGLAEKPAGKPAKAAGIVTQSSKDQDS